MRETAAVAPPRTTLVSTGYQGWTLGDFVAALRAEGVTVLLDLRQNAVSRQRGFSKGTLSRALAEAEIAYRHLPELGNPKDNRPAFARREPHALARYASIIDANEPLLAGLAAQYRSATTAWMCFETDEAGCHRRFVLERLHKLMAAPRCVALQHAVLPSEDRRD